MTKAEINKKTVILLKEVPGNIIDEAHADSPEIAGLQLYDEPLIGYCSAEDELFARFKQPEVVGPWMKAPVEWLPEAKTVISLFFPFTARVKESNAKMKDFASPEWTYARVEGQAFINNYMKALKDYFEDNGVAACVPTQGKRFAVIAGGRSMADLSAYGDVSSNAYGSSWSERHVAFVCGLGTFGMSRGLITAKGMAGRFGSIIVSAELEPDLRPYTDVYEYCIKCGKCADNCPVNAFPVRGGLKDHNICMPHVEESKKVLAPRYGCGLCQVNVPCQDGIPKK